MRSSRFFFLIASGLVLMLLLLPLGCSEETPEKPQKPEKAEKPIKSSSPAAIALPALKLQAFADLPPQEPLAVTPALQDRAMLVDKAVNYHAVIKFLELKLSRAQKDFLNPALFNCWSATLRLRP